MNDTTLFFGTGWDPYYPPPGQEKKQPVVPEPTTGWMIGTFVLLYGTVLLARKTRRFSKTSKMAN